MRADSGLRLEALPVSGEGRFGHGKWQRRRVLPRRLSCLRGGAGAQGWGSQRESPARGVCASPRSVLTGLHPSGRFKFVPRPGRGREVAGGLRPVLL